MQAGRGAVRAAAPAVKPSLLKRTGQAFASGFHPTNLAAQLGPMALFMAPWLLAGGEEGSKSPSDFDQYAGMEDVPSKPRPLSSHRLY